MQSTARTRSAPITDLLPESQLPNGAASSTDAPSAPVHRALYRFPRDRRGLRSGLIVGALLAVAAFALAGPLWAAQRSAVAALLRFSDTPHRIVDGSTFVVSSSAMRTPPAAGIAGIAAFVALSVVAARWRRIPVPAKVLWLLFAAVGLSTLVYTTFVSGAPPHAVDRLTIGFHRSGLLAVVIGTFLFAFEIFPVPGRFRVKCRWLGGLVGFVLALAVVRMAVALATVHHLGSWTFLYVHYLAGPMSDFLAVVAFYSLATYSLAKQMREPA
ncbi:MAG: hypothetical protein ACRDJM_07050 [Actinomycetota bacterium]